MQNNDVKEQDTIKKLVQRNFSIKRIISLVQRGIRSIFIEGFEATYKKVAFRVAIIRKAEIWMYKSDMPTKKELRRQKRVIFETSPFFSILVPAYNTPGPFLNDMIRSCLNQSYANFELCIADASDGDSVNSVVNSYRDERIKYKKLQQNKGIAENTNEAFKMASSENENQFFILLDHDDLLRQSALFEATVAINSKGADFIYSDEIILSEDLKKLKSFQFKPDYSPDTLRGCNYITHMIVFSRKLGEKAGLYEKKEYDGAQDYDLVLRLTEQAEKIMHIPKVLYTWRAHGASIAGSAASKPYAIEAGRMAIQSHLERVGLQGKVESLSGPGSYRIKYDIYGRPKVSIIIPNKDHKEDLKRCVYSIYEKNRNIDFEIVIVENNSTEKETFLFYDELEQEGKNCKIVKYSSSFNFSAICNMGVNNCTGEHVLLLNNDVEMLSENFIEEMLMFSQREDVGAVGAKLYYPDGKIQHAGVFIGLGGSAGHSHKGHLASSGGDMYRLATAQNMSAVTGACLMVKKALYKKVNGLDEEMFAIAFNDVDFCLKLREIEYLNVMTPFAEGIHYESLTRGYEDGSVKEERFEKEKANLRNKYRQLFKEGDPYYNPHLTLKFENYGIE